MIRKFKYCIKRLLLLIINKINFKNKKFFSFKYLIGLYLLYNSLPFILKLPKSIYNYYLWINGRYDLITDALIYQNKTLGNISSFKILCSFSHENKFYFSKSTDFKLNVNGTFLHFCNANLQEKFQAKEAWKNFVLNKTRLEENDLARLKFENVSKGFYEPPLCIQNYLLKTNNLVALKIIYTELESKNEKNFQKYIKSISYKSNIIESLKKDLTLVIIPFLNRENNLKDLLINLHGFLQRQFLRYQIVVAEQINSNDPFNKGRLYNAAFKLINDLLNSNVNFSSSFYYNLNSNLFELFNHNKYNLNCVVLQDVDLIPESDFNLYKCSDLPRHLSLMIRKEKGYFKSPYEFLIGGVLLMKPNIYTSINGFSNEFWSWGGEDDDLAFRLIAKKYCVRRPNVTHALYKMLNHKPSKRNLFRSNMLFDSINRMSYDGLSNLENLNVRIVDVKFYSLFTHLKIHVSERDIGYFFKYLF